MAVYAVYAPPGDVSRSDIAERVVFVREGFRMVAFLLPWLYFLLNRAWLPLVLYVFGLAVINGAAYVLVGTQALIAAVNLLYAVLIGLEAPGLRQWSLSRKGLAHIASVVARRAEDAEMRFFSSLSAVGRLP